MVETNEEDYIETRGVILRDRNGRMRGKFCLRDDDTPILALYESDGTRRVGIGLVDDGAGGVCVALQDRAGVSVACLLVKPDGRGSVEFFDASGETILGFGANADGEPELIHNGAPGGTFPLSELGNRDKTPDEPETPDL